MGKIAKSIETVVYEINSKIAIAVSLTLVFITSCVIGLFNSTKNTLWGIFN